MRKHHLLSLLLIIYMIPCKSQDSLYILHPVVGEIIDITEKRDFLLFPDIDTNNFKCCYIIQSNNNFLLKSITTTDSVTAITITTEEIDQYKNNIDKLNEYYTSQSLKDSSNYDVKKVNLTILNSSSFQLNRTIINSTDRESVLKQTKVIRRLQDDEYRNKLQKQGSSTGGAYIELFNTNNRKKKK